MDSYTKFFKKLAIKNIPLHCLFELTYRCNLRCIHCYIAKNTKKEINKEEIFKILKQLEKAGCLYLTFSGGEILIRKDFFEIAKYSRDLNFALRLFTNGTLIDEKTADKIKDLKPIVEISLYGFKNTHERITQTKGSFSRTVNAIKLLTQKQVKVYVKAILMKQNTEEFWELNEFVRKDLKANWRGIGGGLLISPCDDGNKKPLNYRLTAQQLKKYIQEEFRHLKILGKDYKPQKVKQNSTLCGAGFVNCNITPYGEINPCVQIRFKNNKIKNNNLFTLFKNHPQFQYLRSLRIKDLECKNCKLLSWCVRCPGISLLERGSLLAKLPEACRQAEIRQEIYKNFKEN
ncbi:MAG: radical SAM protein [Candidatus Omnitrophica bacterium]|nr:radical SAM protein [Candidatus Omnitrophota bacterium]